MSISKDPADVNINNKFFCYTPSARVAFKTILENIDFHKDEKILLPAYIGITDREGSGVFDPVRQSRIKFDFYSLDNMLSLNYAEIAKKINENRIKVLLVIHYFGFFQKNMRKLKQLCKKRNVILIEDCAHAMDLAFRTLNGNSVGHIGDYAFYSVHKYLPTKDGGFYTFREESHINHSYYNAKNISHEAIYHLQIADYDQIRVKRINNYNYMLKQLKPNAGKYSLLHEKLGNNIVPHNFPIVVKNKKREELYFKLIDRHIPVVALYYRLIDEISKSSYPISYTISEGILNFPIHQDIEYDDIDSMINTFQRVLDTI